MSDCGKVELTEARRPAALLCGNPTGCGFTLGVVDGNHLVLTGTLVKIVAGSGQVRCPRCGYLRWWARR